MMEPIAAVEAMLFVAEEPIPPGEIAEVLELPLPETEDLLEELAERLTERHSGLVLREIGGGWRLYTRPEALPFLERYAASARATRLSKQALETLAVVAYRQPVSRAQVSEIRGVDSEHALRTLERRGLIDEAGRAPGAGQALLYGTTPLFLEKLGIRAVEDLPPLADHIPPAEVVDTLERPFRPEEPSSDSRS
ncbi:MAG: SMC-Scp complex subunit ScpB [Actinomycetota bacterium]|jgi:segregation and condensation protein B